MHRQLFRQGVLGDCYDVVVCRGCGAGFADGIVDTVQSESYYAERSKYGYEDNGGSESVYDFKRFEMIAEQVAPLLSSKGARLLDIGCATGGLLAALKKRGFHHLLGADPSPACASAAHRLHGLEVRVCTLRQTANWKDRFDLILMVGVLEHIRDASAAIRAAGNLLREGGHMFVSVPNVQGLAQCRNAPFQQFSMEHVNFFSQMSLDRVMSESGYGARKTWTDVVEWREGITEPVISGIYQRAETAPPLFDSNTESSLERYIAMSENAELKITEKIAELVKSREPVIVWGAGAFVRQLLATTTLGEANISCFVDANPHLTGKLLAGRNVISPLEFGSKKDPIIIGSVAFEKEIVSNIRNRLMLPNRLLLLGNSIA